VDYAVRVTLRRALVLLTVPLLALAPLGSTACRTATQIHVRIVTSDGVCTAGGTAPGDKRTGLFVGAAGSSARTAQSGALEGCAKEMGSVTLVPSGREGDPLVEVAMLLTKGDPATCRDKPAACITARRRLGFQENRELSLSIVLDSSCIGVPCGIDQTCDNGACRDATVSCVGDDCSLSPATDGGATVDAGTDGGGDADAPDAGGRCPIGGQPVTQPEFAGVDALAGTGTRLFLVHADTFATVDESGAVTVKKLPGTGLPAVTGAAAFGTTLAIRRGPRLDLVTAAPPFDVPSLAAEPFAVQAPASLVIGAASGLLHFQGVGPAAPTPMGTVTSIASGPGFVFAVQPGGKLHVADGGGSYVSGITSATVSAIVTWKGSPPTAVVAVDGALKLVALPPSGNLTETPIAAIQGAKLPLLAIAGDDLLWTDNVSDGVGAPQGFKLFAARLPPPAKGVTPRLVKALPPAAALDPALTLGALGRCVYVRTSSGVFAYPIPD
jgi:hypothetical protein